MQLFTVSLFQENVVNNSPSLILREFFNMVLIFISVLIWYFLSQVSAQVLKVRLKKLYSRWSDGHDDDKNTIIRDNIGLGPTIPDTVDSEGGGPPVDQCTCPCSCGFNDRMDFSGSTSYGVYSNFADNHSVVISEKSVGDKVGGDVCDHIALCNLESIQDDTDQEVSSQGSSFSTESDLQEIIASVPSVLKIPSIVITPVTQPTVSKQSAPYPLRTSDPLEQPISNYDSGKGSSEITFATPETSPPLASESTSSLGSIASNFSNANVPNNSTVFMNGSFKDSARMHRSQSADVRGSLVNLHIDLGKSGGSMRNSKSMHDLDCVHRRTPNLLRKHNKNLSRSLQSFAIHTQLFEDMMTP